MLGRFVKTLRQKHYELAMARHNEQGRLSMQDELRYAVSTPTEVVHFRDKPLAEKWARENGIAPGRIHTGTSPSHFDPLVMRWILKMRREGLDTGELRSHIITASRDNFDDLLTAFRSEKSSPVTALEMLKMSFALNRSDGAQTIAQWARENPKDWFNPDALVGPNDDPRAQHYSLANAVCLFGRLMDQPALLAWLFEHQLHMKHHLQDPQQWDALQDKLRRSIDPMFVPTWPATAHHVFRVNVSPIQPHWPVDNFSFVSNSIPAFGHDPAAQCYLVYQYVNKRITDNLVQKACPEAVELHHRLQSLVDPNHTRPADAPAFNKDIVAALMIGVQLDLDSESFYYHAQGCFAPEQRKAMDTHYENLDGNLFEPQRA